MFICGADFFSWLLLMESCCQVKTNHQRCCMVFSRLNLFLEGSSAAERLFLCSFWTQCEALTIVALTGLITPGCSLCWSSQLNLRNFHSAAPKIHSKYYSYSRLLLETHFLTNEVLRLIPDRIFLQRFSPNLCPWGSRENKVFTPVSAWLAVFTIILHFSLHVTHNK